MLYVEIIKQLDNLWIKYFLSEEEVAMCVHQQLNFRT